MGTSTLNQSHVFLLAVYGGLTIGVLYDIIRIIRWTLGAGRVVNAVFDSLFWLISTVVMLIVLYRATSGVPRFFAFLGFALGFAVYMAGLGKLIVSLFLVIKKVFIRIFSVIWKKIKKT